MWSGLLSNEAIISMVGHEAFARGMVYARNGQVSEVQIDPEKLLVSGRVQGGYRDGYSTTVQLVGSEHGWTGHRGRCSCPVAQDCKHAAALLIATRTQIQLGGVQQRPAWEIALERLVRAPESVSESDQAPLGLEFSVERLPAYRGHRAKSTLRIRPIREGHRGNWVRGGIAWDELDYPAHRHPSEQLDLLLQLRTAAGAAARFRLPRSPWLPLTDVTAALWTLLADAERIGLRLLVEGSAGTSPMITRSAAAMMFDAQREPAGTVLLEPSIMLDGNLLASGAYGLLGDPVHGLYRQTAVDEYPHGGLRLAQFVEPLSREQRRLLTEPSPLVIPAGDEQRFLTEYLPAVRRRAGVLSRDGSVDLPDGLAPGVALSVSFRPEHRVRLDWSVTYGADEALQRFELDEPVTSVTVRDLVGEDELLARLPLPYARIPTLSEQGEARPAAHVLLSAGDAAVFVDQVLPELTAAGVAVSTVGTPVAYRQPDSEPIVEVSASDTSSADWFDLQIRVRVDSEVVSFEDLFVALSRSEDFLITDSGVYLSLERSEFDRLRVLIEEARLLQDSDRPGLRINRVQLALWDELIALGVVLHQSHRWLRSVHDLLERAPTDDVTPPPTLQAQLRPYQGEGFRWLHRLWTLGLGGILADDMGLGKTVQALALICRARLDRPDNPPFLVVAPTSVVTNWATEIHRFAPALTVITATGSRGRRHDSLRDLTVRPDVVVTSYALLRLDLHAYLDQEWAGMILDEAQFVKNYRARTYTAARRIATDFKLAITGTPMENNLMDLWSLFSLTAPGLFPHPERFAEYYRRPIERDHDATRLAQLRRRIAPFLLRRTKEAVAADLPAKQEQVVEVILQPRHQRIYQTHLQRERQKVLGLIDDLEGNRFTILRSLTLLRQLTLDPVLVNEQHAGAPASKIEVLLTMLDELVREGHSALVFSQFTGFLDRIALRLHDDGIAYARLDGRTRNRAEVIERFRRGDARVFLISLKAGGFGLNLTEADYCFVLDPWWNPAAEAQAVDRTHRIGQQRTVMVYRLVARDTIEEKVMDLKARKERLVSAVLSHDVLGGQQLAASDIRELLELRG
jgi:superfamily II DNA or RNA helicase